MAKMVRERDYTDYEYLSKDEAEYLGYDIEDDSDYDGFTIIDPAQEEAKSRKKEDSDFRDDKETDEIENSESTEFDDDDWTEADNPGDNEKSGDTESDEDELRELDEADEEEELGYPEIDGHVFKDPLRYNQALYQKDVSQYKNIAWEDQLELFHSVRKGMLCDCSIMPEDPDVPEDYPYKLADKTSRVLKRLCPTNEEMAWVEHLSEAEKKNYISEGRNAQEKLICCNLPLVMDRAGGKYKSIEFLDRVQVGNMGLLKAVQYFNPNRGNKFTTFATYLIEREISDYADELKKQKYAQPKEKGYVATEDDIEQTCEFMGGKFWLQEITVDTEQEKERIKKQVGVLLEIKDAAESAANFRLFGDNADYTDVLTKAENSQTGSYWKRPESEKDNRKQKLDRLKGDGKFPKEKELSTEDFIRSFFQMVINIKTISPYELAWFVVREKKTIEKKAKHLRSFIKSDWSYTEEAAIYDLWNLVRHGSIWPEKHAIEQAKEWGWIPKNGGESHSY